MSFKALEQRLQQAASENANRSPSVDYLELGFSGDLNPDSTSRVVSSWLSGYSPALEDHLEQLNKAGKKFRFLFPERYYAPAQEAHRLFTGKHLGAQIHFLSKVQAHSEWLKQPADIAGQGAWLREPVLNRIPLIVWMMGEVRDVRVFESTIGKARTIVCLFRHRGRGRLSVLDITVSPDFTQAGKPGLLERFECSGSDGFLVVNGCLEPARSFPRLELHRGAMQMVQRDLSREQDDWHRTAVNALRKDASARCGLAANYLAACRMVQTALTQTDLVTPIG